MLLAVAGQLTQGENPKHKDDWLKAFASRASPAYTATCKPCDQLALWLSQTVAFYEQHIKGDRETALTHLGCAEVLW
jgi:hypothetical protein